MKTRKTGIGFIILLFTLGAAAQPGTPTTINKQPWYHYLNRLSSDTFVSYSAFYAPLKDTTYTPERVGALTFRSADNAFYGAIALTGRKWQKIGNVDTSLLATHFYVDSALDSFKIATDLTFVDGLQRMGNSVGLGGTLQNDVLIDGLNWDGEDWTFPNGKQFMLLGKQLLFIAPQADLGGFNNIGIGYRISEPGAGAYMASDAGNFTAYQDSLLIQARNEGLVINLGTIGKMKITGLPHSGAGSLKTIAYDSLTKRLYTASMPTNAYNVTIVSDPSSDYTATEPGYYELPDISLEGGSRAFTLPDAAAHTGKMLVVKNNTSDYTNLWTLPTPILRNDNSPGSELAAFTTTTLMSNGTYWVVLSMY